MERLRPAPHPASGLSTRRALSLAGRLTAGRPWKRRLERRVLRSLRAAAWLCCGILLVGTSNAIGSEPSAPPETGAHRDQSRHRLQWTYRRARPWQYVAIGVQSAANLTFEFGNIPSPGEHWRDPLPGDLPIRNALLARTEEGRQRARTVADTTWHVVQYYPVVVDGLLVPLAFDKLNADVAWQLSVINWQTLGLTGIVTRIAHKTVPRGRPSTWECERDRSAPKPCPEAGPGFFSGHVAMTTAGAALSCSHHAALPLYGRGPAGTLTCMALSTGAVAVGIGRITADKHWASEILVGHLVGAGFGLGMPWLLAYRYPQKPAASSAMRSAWIPVPMPGGGGLSFIGQF